MQNSRKSISTYLENDVVSIRLMWWLGAVSNKQLPEPILTCIYVAIRFHKNTVTWWYISISAPPQKVRFSEQLSRDNVYHVQNVLVIPSDRIFFMLQDIHKCEFRLRYTFIYVATDQVMANIWAWLNDIICKVIWIHIFTILFLTIFHTEILSNYMSSKSWIDCFHI